VNNRTERVRLHGGLGRQLRADKASVVALAAILFGTAFLAAAWPRWLNDIDDRAVRYEFAQSREIDDVRATYVGPVLAGGAAISALHTIGADLLASFDPPLRDLLEPAVISSTPGDYLIRSVNDTPRPEDFPDFFLTPVLLDTERPEVRFVEGAEPAEGPTTAPPDDVLDEDRTIVQVGLSTVGAAALGLEVGDLATASRSPGPDLVLEVTGVYEPIDQTSHTWARHLNLLLDAPVFGPSGELIQNTAGALVTPASFPSLLSTDDGLAVPTELTTSWEFPLDVEPVHAGLVDDLGLAADRAQSDGIVSPSGAPFSIQTTVQEVLDRFRDQRTTAHAVLSIGLVGLLIGALAVLVLVAQLTSERRRAALALARARGASLRQLTMITAAEGFLIAGVSVAGGLALAVLAVPARSTPLSWWLAGGLAGASAVVLAAVTWSAHRAVGPVGRRDLATGGSSPRRLAAELALVLLAAVGVVLLRDRGFDTAVVGGSADPFLLAVPALIALAASVAVLRVYPAPIRLVGRFMANRRGPVSFLGLLRAGREATGRAIPLVVVLVALSFSVFAAIVVNSVRLEQDVRSWELVGAPVRVDGTDFDQAVDVPRMAAAARVTLDRTFGIHARSTALDGRLGDTRDRFTLLLLDPSAFQTFVADRVIDTTALEPLVNASAGDGTRVPMVVSPAFAIELSADGRVGSELRDLPFLLPGSNPVLDAVGTIDFFLGLESDQLWAVGRTPDAERVVDLAYGPTILLLDAEDADTDAILAAAQVTQPFAQITTRNEVYEQIAGSPLVAGTERTFQAATLAAAAYSALSVVPALVVTARSRERFLSCLRTLGLSSRQVRGLVAWEIVPTTMIAIGVGAALGFALPYVVLPAIDLTPFTGGLDQPTIYADGATIGALAGGICVVVVVAVLGVTSINRRTRLGAVLRVGEDG